MQTTTYGPGGFDTTKPANNVTGTVVVPDQPEVLNGQAIAASIQTKLGQIEAWIAANPNGAVLNAAQTLALAKMLVGLGRLQLQLLATVGQAT